MIVRRLQSTDFDEWLRMRLALWPDHSLGEMQQEMVEIQQDLRQPVFVAQRPEGGLAGFLEASVHVDVYGCESKPVGYIEGWYVDLDQRRLGLGGKLVAAAETWAIEQGLQAMASDCEIDNLVSLQAHQALGYQEVERLIHFCKKLTPNQD